MALPSNKSSSSISSRANQVISRNSENAIPMRKSFSGNPFTKPLITANSRGFNPNTPANSPSDFPRRNSIDGQSVGSLRELEEKENSKDQNVKAARVRSPTVSKCTKNFMSPTISAASKISSASPKKKILVERNEPVRTSFSLSDWKSSSLNSVNPTETMEVNDSKSDTTLDQKSINATHDSTLATSVPRASKKTVTFLECDDLTSISQIDSELLPETDSEEPDCVNLDPSFKISPTSSCPPILAPLDADPSMPPYDPKTNYLSPRPQFLHYRPNPRIERYLNMEEDGKRLEDSFVSGSFSDTEETQSDNSVKESDEVSSVEFVKEEEAEVCVSEPSSITATALEENVKAAIKNSSKPHFLKRNKFTIMLLIVWIACFSTLFTCSLVFDPNIYEGSSFLSNDPSELFDYAKEKYDGLVQNLRVWSANSISYLYQAISNFRSAKNLGSLQYFNLTASLNEGISIDGYLVFDQSHDALGPIQESVVEMGSSVEEEDNPNQPEDGFDEDSEYEEQEQRETDEEESHESFEEQVVDFEDLELAPLPEAVEAEEVEPTPPPLSVEADDSEAAAGVNFELDETHVDSSEHQSRIEMGVQSGIYVSNEATKGEESTVFESIKPDADALESLEVDESSRVNPPRTEEDVDLTHKLQVVIALLIVLPLIVGTVFVYARRTKKSTISNAAAISKEKQYLLPKKKEFSPLLSVGNEHAFMDRPTEVDMVGESCPSELSSFQRNSSRMVVGGSNEEAQSHEKRPRKNNHRRESMSSSMDYSMSTTGSPSYGSFTTYEKISIKHGLGEEETITPVRRSSRIRKQVTSP